MRKKKARTRDTAPTDQFKFNHFDISYLRLVQTVGLRPEKRCHWRRILAVHMPLQVLSKTAVENDKHTQTHKIKKWEKQTKERTRMRVCMGVGGWMGV